MRLMILIHWNYLQKPAIDGIGMMFAVGPDEFLKRNFDSIIFLGIRAKEK
jgi:hypothetical protein